jgi:hypothetical protein
MKTKWLLRWNMKKVDFKATLNTWNEMKLYGIDCSIEDDWQSFYAIRFGDARCVLGVNWMMQD